MHLTMLSAKFDDISIGFQRIQNLALTIPNVHSMTRLAHDSHIIKVFFISIQIPSIIYKALKIP